LTFDHRGSLKHRTKLFKCQVCDCQLTDDCILNNHMLLVFLIFIAVTVELENDRIQETPTPNNNCVSNKRNGHNIKLKNDDQIPGYLSIYTVFQVFFYN